MRNALRYLSRDQNSKIKTGLYKHYKGKMYFVLGSGKNSETLEDMVIYQAMYNSPQFGELPIWIRPLSMFLEYVKVDDKDEPRFTPLGDEETVKFEKEFFEMVGKVK